ncbi:MAG: tetratricopeptide repeat protein [Verrucomicrobia bacterium]|nr:tetratricopeptide repeat protein [Verrucomicrobiota bacterium]
MSPTGQILKRRITSTVRRRVPAFLLAVLCGWLALPARADDLDAARKLLLTGKYPEAITAATKGVQEEEGSEEWRLLLVQSHMAVGQYSQAHTALTNALGKYPHSASIRLRFVGRDVKLFNGLPDDAKEFLDEINRLAGSQSWRYRDPANITALGRAALLLGADPKLVLDRLFDPVKKAAPDLRDIHLATGQLALDKGDHALAARIFQDAIKRFKSDADFQFGLARSLMGGSRPQALRALELAMEFNEKHIPSRLLLVDHLVDAEEYEEAEKLLKEVLEVNVNQPEAWAYRAVMAHLRNDKKKEAQFRTDALRHYTNNPAVDQLIGRKLSQKYRFTEGAAYQRLALKSDRNFLPAKFQLAQDLLRLGEEDEGWRLVADVHEADGYDVNAYNLVTLKDTTDKFVALTNEHFTIRMDAREAKIYGPRVMALLQRAHDTLTKKYGLKLEKRTIVEIYTEQKDFGVRTFGMPDNPGFLGVCFGCLITANSPASARGHASNWEATLWHEFCHVITLTLTKNKMPRWLSEGISVYEERQASPAWGQVMNPRYREMILGDELTAVGDLSSAFLTAKSDLHLQFAYYESSLVVQFLMEKFGVEKLRKILADLATGKEINKAIVEHTAPLEKIEKDFEAYAQDLAKKLAPGLDFEKPKGMAGMLPGMMTPGLRPPDGTVIIPPAVPTAPDGKPILDPLKLHPKNFHVLTQQSKKLMTEKKWAEAKEPLKKLIENYPTHTGGDSALWLLAQVHRELKETSQERELLSKLAALDADAVDAYLRLIELAAATKDWPVVAENARRYLAVNPLVPQPHRWLARASEELKQPQEAIAAYQTVLLLDPPDPADVHFRLATLFTTTDAKSAKQHVLMALEEAPRFRAAHELLLKLAATEKPSQTESKPKRP